MYITIYFTYLPDSLTKISLFLLKSFIYHQIPKLIAIKPKLNQNSGA